ncbi:MAG TPA: serine/threonine-protein kinase [Streptosporangiaceae bacterium]
MTAGDPRRVGSYQLLGRLGCGGMGSVFLGRSAAGSLVAVKVIRADLADDPGFRARFDREVAAARKVSGRFTAAVADADTSGPVPWLATSYVPGPSLAELVRTHGALPLSAVLALGAGLAQALGVIHAAGLVHRDLKPSNVLVAADGPRVIDFGISRAAGASSLTQVGMVMGSPGFMSPEQAKGGLVGPASDVFSLGTLLAFAATGHGPFGAGSMAALLYRVVYGQPSTGQLPGQLRPLVERCLDKDPSQRPSPAQLLAELGDTRPCGDWLSADVAEMLSQFAAPEAARAEAARAEVALAEAGQTEAAASPPGWVAPAQRPAPAADRPGWLPMTGSQLPVPASPGSASPVPATPVLADPVPAGQLAAVGSALPAADPARPPAASQLPGIGSAVPQTGMELPVVGGEPLVPDHQPPVTDEEPTVTVVRPRRLRNAPRPRAAAVAPPRHPGRRRRSRLWAAAGAGTGAAGVLVAVMLTGILQPAVRHDARPARAAAKLPGPAAVLKAHGPHRPSAHHHRHRDQSGSGVTMAVAASSSPSPGSTMPAVRPGSSSPATAPSPSAAPTPTRQPASSTYSRAVPGSQEWTATGITVQPGDQLTIVASGEIYIGATSADVGPAGDPGCTPAASYPAQRAQFPAPDLTCWSLIGRIGAGAPFAVGGSAQLTATGGELYLGVNGDSFTGNSGGWSATITVRSRAA